MSCNAKKNLSRLVAKMRLLTSCGRHFVDVYLWPNLEDMREQAQDVDNASACFKTMPSRIVTWEKGHHKERAFPKLGELHFAAGKWDMEIVAHECEHALIHRIRFVEPMIRQIIDQFEGAEETICYEFGQWVAAVYRWLWEHNPSVKWTKETT